MRKLNSFTFTIRYMLIFLKIVFILGDASKWHWNIATDFDIGYTTVLLFCLINGKRTSLTNIYLFICFLNIVFFILS